MGVHNLDRDSVDEEMLSENNLCEDGHLSLFGITKRDDSIVVNFGCSMFKWIYSSMAWVPYIA